jgi:hypothetical protein
MKKLMLVCFICIAHLSYSQDIYITLNGIEMGHAKDLISTFKARVAEDKQPLPTNIWFDRNQIKNIAVLLDKEKNTKGTDGLRIYFTYDGTGAQLPHINNIALVSTKNNGWHTGLDNKRYIWHLDYYDHDHSAPLFTDVNSNYKKLEGLLSNYDKDPDARLYNAADIESDDPGCWAVNNGHIIKIAAGKQMVNNFKQSLGVNRNYAINTYSVWFGLQFIDDLAKELYTATGHSGIRIYFAEHSQDAELLVAGRDTFIITTTDAITSQRNRDYFTCTNTKTLKVNQPRKNIKHKAGKTNFKNITRAIPPLPPSNNGELCPFNCN